MLASSRRSGTRRASKSAVARNGRRRAILSRKSVRAKAGSSSGNGSKPKYQSERGQLDRKYLAIVKNFEAAKRHFNRQRYAKAKELFLKVQNGAPREVAERARVHISLCEQKLAKPAPAPKTPSDYYALGVAELNARNLDLALQYLTKADKAAHHRDHVHYALAAAHALMGSTDAALEHLQAAIELRSENRFLVRHDEDFESLRTEPRYRTLIYPDNGSNGF